jgi:hypothetical protein
VVAYSVARGVPYAEAHAKLSEIGRKRGCSIHWRKHAECLGFEMRPEFSCMTVEKALAAMPPGRFVVRIARHVFAVVDGVATDRNALKLGARVQMVYELKP